MKTPHLRTAVALSALVMSGLGTTALAAGESPHDLKANVALTTNYLYRGISQTNNGPAVQGGFDYTYVPWSLYASVWGSNVDSSSASGYYTTTTAAGQTVVSNANDPTATYIPLKAPGYSGAPMELDLKAGWAPTFGKLGLDLGYLRYQYPRTTVSANNTNEYHLGLSYDIAGYATPKFTANYSDNFFGFKSAWYYDLTVPVNLPYAFTLTGHYGWTRYNNSAANGGGASYDDYSVGLSHEVYKGVVLTASWVDRNKHNLCAAPFQCGSYAVATLSKTF
ncbi:TorF family putative porin [uncultured Thiodictyon sp.]|uniref:TorF family putative porin n=1 Tax=uncultured Thiodictyon sp. TaxID=1846217 RepID=UPI0025DF34A9|nr:TorF family putative porin [uncultured Thiodictyon sp.]